MTVSISTVFSQDHKGTFSKNELNSVTGTKPEDGKPAVVNSKEELNLVVPGKVEWMKEMVLSGKFDEEGTRKIRESIWRFENAVIRDENK